MRYFSYNEFKELHKNVKPYRRTNHIPYADRTHRHKFFVPVEVNGDVEYHLSYYWDWDKEVMDMAEFEQAKEHMSKKQLNSWSHPVPEYWDGQHFYHKYTKTVKPFGIIRSDNTLEIVTNSMHQGLRMHLTDKLKGVVVMSDCRSGGAILADTWREASRRLKIPMFKGMRFNLDTYDMHESSRYIIDIKRVDVKKSNEVLKGYRDNFAVMKAFYKTMDRDAFASELKETAKTHFLDGTNNYMRELLDLAADKGAMMFKENPMEASYITILGNGLGNARWAARADDKLYYEVSWYARRAEEIIRLNLKYRHDTFTRVKYWDFDKKYPQSRWGMDIKDINGNKLQQL